MAAGSGSRSGSGFGSASASGEWARYWQYAELPDLDLLRARYVRHTFPRHSHEGYVFGTITRGIEDVGLPGGTVHAGPGAVVMINPEVPHTARAGVPRAGCTPRCTRPHK